MFSKVKFEINLVLAKIYGLKLKFKLSRIGKNIWLIEKIYSTYKKVLVYWYLKNRYLSTENYVLVFFSVLVPLK